MSAFDVVWTAGPRRVADVPGLVEAISGDRWWSATLGHLTVPGAYEDLLALTYERSYAVWKPSAGAAARVLVDVDGPWCTLHTGGNLVPDRLFATYDTALRPCPTIPGTPGPWVETCGVALVTAAPGSDERVSGASRAATSSALGVLATRALT